MGHRQLAFGAVSPKLLGQGSVKSCSFPEGAGGDANSRGTPEFTFELLGEQHKGMPWEKDELLIPLAEQEGGGTAQLTPRTSKREGVTTKLRARSAGHCSGVVVEPQGTPAPPQKGPSPPGGSSMPQQPPCSWGRAHIYRFLLSFQCPVKGQGLLLLSSSS